MHSPLARSGFSQITRRCGTSLGRGLVLKAHWRVIGLADATAIGAHGAGAVKYRIDAINTLRQPIQVSDTLNDGLLTRLQAGFPSLP